MLVSILESSRNRKRKEKVKKGELENERESLECS